LDRISLPLCDTSGFENFLRHIASEQQVELVPRRDNVIFTAVLDQSRRTSASQKAATGR
jgi:hypothetical protein